MLGEEVACARADVAGVGLQGELAAADEEVLAVIIRDAS